MPLERQKNVQNTPKTQKMTEKPLKHKKLPKYPQNIEMNPKSQKMTKAPPMHKKGGKLLDYLNNTRGDKINPNLFAHPNPPT